MLRCSHAPFVPSAVMTTALTVAYLFMVWGLVLRLIFLKRLNHTIKKLDKKMTKLLNEARQTHDDFSPGNQWFSHAPWALICVSGETWRVTARSFRRSNVAGMMTIYAPRNRSCQYQCVYDNTGVFGKEASIGKIAQLDNEGRKLLGLPELKPEEPEPAIGHGELPWGTRLFSRVTH